MKPSRTHVGDDCQSGGGRRSPNLQSDSSDLSCAQSSEGDSNVQPRVAAGGTRHEHAGVCTGFTEGLFG